MSYKKEKHYPKPKNKHNKNTNDDLFDICIRKGLIEKTENGYIFKPEFFETLEIYEEDV